MKLYCRLLTSITLCYALVGCTTKPETTSAVESDSQSVTMPDTITSIKKETPIHVPEGSLLIHGKDIWVRDYPNTGKVVMTLSEGDVCKIITQGRYDVIRGKGNHWYQIESNGKTGWVFGSQTSKESEDWTVPKSVARSNYPIDKIKSSNFDELFKIIFDSIKKTEFPVADDDEGQTSKTVTMENNGIQAMLGGETGVVHENFNLGPRNSILQMINYKFMTGAASMISFDMAIIFTKKDSQWSCIDELPGKAVEIIPLKNNNFLLVTNYERIDMGTEQVGFTNFAVYNSSTNSITNSQQLGFCRYPKYGGPYDSYYTIAAKPTFDQEDGILLLTLLEEFDRYDSESRSAKGKIKRFYKFNESRNSFEEFKQEENI
jgi:hypothetical protein